MTDLVIADHQATFALHPLEGSSRFSLLGLLAGLNGLVSTFAFDPATDELNGSEKNSFDRALKSVYDQLDKRTPEQVAADVAKHDAWSKEWDDLRAQLLPCHCGAPNTELQFQCARLGGMSYVWCTRCSYGSPVQPHDLIAQLETGEDARPVAIQLWNTEQHKRAERLLSLEPEHQGNK